jgi:uncharacterized protein (TIGR00299 family) protein
MVVILDPQSSGIAGNMIVGALIDLGADTDKTNNIMEHYASFFGQITSKISKIKKKGISSTYFAIECQDRKTIKYTDLLRRIETIKHEKMTPEALNLAKNIFHTLAIAETKIHNKSIADINFHEVGAADAVADVIGSAYAFCSLGLNEEKVYGLPVSLGGGITETAHGTISIPAPATLEILKKVPTVGGPVMKELTTPTGAAIYMNLADEFCQFHPLLANKTVGYGAGKMDLPFPNVFRIIRGSETLPTDKVSVLETNLDNVSGEILGNIFNKLMDKGALDVSLIPILMKKNRPGHLLKVISRPENCDTLSEIIFRETGTLGVRVMPLMHRNILEREIIPITVDFGTLKAEIRIKVGFIGEEIINTAPEYEDALQISERIGLPIKEVMRISEETFWQKKSRKEQNGI